MKKSKQIAATIRAFVEDRDRTFTNAVIKDDWDGVRAYLKRHDMPVPESEDVMKAAIYKAVQEITTIPADVKKLAARKCVDLGFWPWVSI